jgi:spore maturation protein CgeB
MRYDYGKPERGLSFEETNFRSALEGMGHDVVPFDFMSRERSVGRQAMRGELVAAASETQPDLAFFVLFTEQIDTATIEMVRQRGSCVTANWFADDHWRFEGFSRHLAPAFDLAVTTDADSLPRYRELPGANVLLSQWACNKYLYTRSTTEIRHGVTFVGQPHGNRRQMIAELRRRGVEVECWGHGWSNGRLEHADMVDVFSSSAINLNLSNSSDPRGWRSAVARLLGRPTPVRRPPQIKGRNFEVPGCGGFILTERLPHLDDYFVYDREIGVYSDAAELAERIRWWLEHPAERGAVADAGYERVIAEHTYDHRFAAIFDALGLQ